MKLNHIAKLEKENEQLKSKLRSARKKIRALVAAIDSIDFSYGRASAGIHYGEADSRKEHAALTPKTGREIV